MPTFSQLWQLFPDSCLLLFRDSRCFVPTHVSFSWLTPFLFPDSRLNHLSCMRSLSCQAEWGGTGEVVGVHCRRVSVRAQANFRISEPSPIKAVPQYNDRRMIIMLSFYCCSYQRMRNHHSELHCSFLLLLQKHSCPSLATLGNPTSARGLRAGHTASAEQPKAAKAFWGKAIVTFWKVGTRRLACSRSHDKIHFVMAVISSF